MEMAGEEKAAHSHDDVTFERWDKNSELPSVSGNYYLDSDVQISETWTISNGQNINLCLHDHSITYTADTGSVIRVEENGQLCLYDCHQSEHRYKIIDGLAQLDSNGSKTFLGGCITGGRKTGKMNEECLICKAPLEYLDTDVLIECSICHKKERRWRY